MKKSILIAIISIFTLGSGFGQIIHNSPLPAYACANSQLTLEFYFVPASPGATPTGNYEVRYGLSSGQTTVFATIPCTSWYDATAPGAYVFTFPANSNGNYKLFVLYVGSAAPSPIPTIDVSVCTTVGIENINSNFSLESMYPVPANKDLNIKLNNINEGSKIKIIIYSIEGKKVSSDEKEIIGGKTTVDVSEIPSGVYLIEVNAGDLKTSKRVIIIK
ncbi:MAG: hypothetical protein A3F72_17785 [Bacteroidetes bacterium RIFCSPLOWO2_12_FULL_35_15]|nr:MAG: hypothetical protein A3F72_17785 [Bacteroidetes bacterium RIFCSPLOWO2_12_FULL_35_15]